MKTLVLWVALGLGISPFRAADDDSMGPRPGGRPLAVPNGPSTEIDGRCEAGYRAGAVVPLGNGLELRVLRHGRVLALCVEMPGNTPGTIQAYLTAPGQAAPIDLHARTKAGEDGELQVDLSKLSSENWKLMVEVRQDPSNPSTSGGSVGGTYPPGARYDAPRTWANWRIIETPTER